MLLVSQTKASHIIVYNITRGLSIDKAHQKSSRWVPEITYCTSLLACIWHGVGGFDWFDCLEDWHYFCAGILPFTFLYSLRTTSIKNIQLAPPLLRSAGASAAQQQTDILPPSHEMLTWSPKTLPTKY